MPIMQFQNDYAQGAHPRILKALAEHNKSTEPGYGADRYSRVAADLIRERAGAPDLTVRFLSSGTQTNLVAAASSLSPFEACLAAEGAHIATHETGAIEATGHRIIRVPAREGKLSPSSLREVLSAHMPVHMVRPRLVYISNPTEWGTVYSRDELAALSRFCRASDLLLYCDGARLGQTMVLSDAPLSLADYAALCDAFFLGGTKNGALLGTALCIRNASWAEEIDWHLKQRGALLAKGRLLGITFRTLLEDGLYEELARHAQDKARRLRRGLSDLGIRMASDSPTNQLFPVLTHRTADALEDDCTFYRWQDLGEGRLVLRLVTSWTTTGREVDTLLERLAAEGS